MASRPIKINISHVEGRVTVLVDGLVRDEAETLIAAAVEIEMRRGGDVLTPGEYRARFEGL